LGTGSQKRYLLIVALFYEIGISWAISENLEGIKEKVGAFLEEFSA
jgi:hypothetical protein